jgi:hypothetical protein
MKYKTFTLLLIGAGALLLLVVNELQTTDQNRSVISSDGPTETNDVIREQSSDQLQTADQRIIYRGDPPYLSELPILDGNLFVSHRDDYLLFGGSNIELVRFRAGTGTGDRATVLYREDAIAFLLAEQPYIQFAYQDGFYSIQIFSRAYFFTLDIRELPSASVELMGKFVK